MKNGLKNLKIDAVVKEKNSFSSRNKNLNWKEPKRRKKQPVWSPNKTEIKFSSKAKRSRIEVKRKGSRPSSRKSTTLTSKRKMKKNILAMNYSISCKTSSTWIPAPSFTHLPRPKANLEHQHLPKSKKLQQQTSQQLKTKKYEEEENIHFVIC